MLRATWLSTYPNKEHDISREDIEAINFNRPVVNTETRQSWVAVSDKSVVGVCKALRDREGGLLKVLYVLPEYQSRGIGSALLSHALKWFGTIPVFVNVAIYNEKGKAFYLKHGFIETGEVAASKAATLPSGKIIPEINLAFVRN